MGVRLADLELKNIVKDFGSVRVIHGVDLSIKEGEFAVFVGPSGCGKSTLLRIIAGLETASSGDVLIGGERMNDTPAANRGLAMVFQSYALYPHMSVRQNLSFGLENARMDKAEIERRVQRAASMLQIDKLLERKPRQLSGGQRQRVAIGRAITREPQIFLFDEPLSNLDAELRVQMRVELSKLHADLGNTMIYVTHDQVEAMTMASKIVVLRDGRVEQVGAPLELYNRPANRFVAGFIGSPRMNFLSGRVSEAGADGLTIAAEGLPDIILPSAMCEAGANVTIGVRPEHLVTSASGWPLRVDVVEQLGGSSYLYGTLPSGERLVVLENGQTHVKPGERVAVSVSPAHIHLFGGPQDAAIVTNQA
ncbi:MalK ABC-type sugar transport systems, ATPase components [Rhabdaerophilaceae bacterium]